MFRKKLRVCFLECFPTDEALDRVVPGGAGGGVDADGLDDSLDEDIKQMMRKLGPEVGGCVWPGPQGQAGTRSGCAL